MQNAPKALSAAARSISLAQSRAASLPTDILRGRQGPPSTWPFLDLFLDFRVIKLHWFVCRVLQAHKPSGRPSSTALFATYRPNVLKVFMLLEELKAREHIQDYEFSSLDSSWDHSERAFLVAADEPGEAIRLHCATGQAPAKATTVFGHATVGTERAAVLSFDTAKAPLPMLADISIRERWPFYRGSLLYWLCDQFGGMEDLCMHSDASGAGRIDTWLNLPHVGMRHMGRDGSRPTRGAHPIAQLRQTHLLHLLNKRLRGREFLVGSAPDNLSIADFFWFPIIHGLFNYRTRAVHLGHYPHLAAYRERLLSRATTSAAIVKATALAGEDLHEFNLGDKETYALERTRHSQIRQQRRTQ